MHVDTYFCILQIDCSYIVLESEVIIQGCLESHSYGEAIRQEIIVEAKRE